MAEGGGEDRSQLIAHFQVSHATEEDRLLCIMEGNFYLLGNNGHRGGS